METMTLDKAIRSINRFKEIGVFEMEYVKENIPMDEEKLISFVKWLYSDEVMISKAKAIIEMDEDTFQIHKIFAKAWIKTKDFRAGYKRFGHLKLF